MKDRLKEIRKSLGLTQREMAERLSLKDPSLYPKWEQGSRGISDSRAFQICQTFGVRPEWLETGEGEMWATDEKEVSKREIEKATYKTIFDGLPDSAKQMVGELVDEWRAGKESSAFE